MSRAVRALLVLIILITSGWSAPADEFATKVRPLLAEHCGACHNPSNPKNRVDFLKAQSSQEIDAQRSIWRSAALQLRNRTMPPGQSRLSENDRLYLVGWIESRLRQNACVAGDYAGFVPARRLNRREYHHTIRDLLGVDLEVASLLPADEAAGSGFDTNGETLFVAPMLLERYLEAAQEILDRVTITPPYHKVFAAHDMQPTIPAAAKPGRMLAPGERLSVSIPIIMEGAYSLRVSVERPKHTPFEISLELDGVAAGSLAFARDLNGGAAARAQTVTLSRGVHQIAVVAGREPILFYSLTVEQRPPDAPPDKRALHYRLFGTEAGDAPVDARAQARHILERFLPRAYRRPVEPAEIDRFLAIYDRAAERGDPFEESVKLALKAVLVSPRFLFHIEKAPAGPGIYPLDDFELASRLSYFLWSTMPDDELLELARGGLLQEAAELKRQVERMLHDPRSRAFSAAFVGQWLGTQEVGGRVVPLLTELQHYYTPEVAADLRQEPVLLFHHILHQNRSLLELLTANYTFLTSRLVRFYQLDGKVAPIEDANFHRVEWPDDRRAGILGFASVLAMTSHYRQSSPILRGAWILEHLLGTPVPPPPPDVPPLEAQSAASKSMTMRQLLAKHKADPSCAACHNVMDPLGLALEDFDWMGRWKDQEPDGRAVDASAELPSGERFSGPVGLRQFLLSRREEFLRHLTGKVLAYALGRTLQEGDECTVQKILAALEKENWGARSLIREVVLSLPFRNTQGGIEVRPSAVPGAKRPPRRLLGDK